MSFNFPKDLYTDVRIEETFEAGYQIRDGIVLTNARVEYKGVIVRIFDGKLWYTSVTNDVSEGQIQKEIDNLAGLAKPNPNILKNKIVKNFQVNKDTNLRFDGENDFRKVTREQIEATVNHYVETCGGKEFEEIKTVTASLRFSHLVKKIFSSKGTELCFDSQEGRLGMGFCIVHNEVPLWGGTSIVKFDYKDFENQEQKFIEIRDRSLDYAKNAVDVEPGDYECVLAPIVTAMFTHECFGHKSEADFMLNDKTLQDEWVMGKQVGSELVSICDRGDLYNHGYTPYDDEGNKACETWLVNKGKLTGRLHDAKSASVLKEKITGNARAQSYAHKPLVRMTNTFMEKGTETKDELISKVKNGIYVYSVNYGTGNSTFTMKPEICYRIRDGKLCEPVRVNVITGSVFKTLFDITGVADDLELFDQYVCGKGGQSVPVSAGGPTIRVKTLSIN